MDHFSGKPVFVAPSGYAATAAAPARDAAGGVLRLSAVLLVLCLVLQRFALPVGAQSVEIVGPLGLVLAAWGVSRGYLALHRGRLAVFGLLAAWLLLDTLAQSVAPNGFGVPASLLSLGQFLALTGFAVLSFAAPVDEARFLAGGADILSLIAIAGITQFVAQFAGLGLFAFTGLVPDQFLFESGYNLVIPVGLGDALKSNGFFLLEPSIFSQAMAFGVILESLSRRRPRVLALFVLALILSFSGTGWLILAAFFLFSGARLGRRGVMAASVLGVFILLALIGAWLVVPEIADVFAQRFAEFSEPGTSGNLRFVTPFQFLGDVMRGEHLAWLFGIGAGVSERITLPYAYNVNTPIKIIVEYGLPAVVLYVALFLRAERNATQAALLGPTLVLTFVAGGYQQFGPVLYPALLLICVARFRPVAAGVRTG